MIWLYAILDNDVAEKRVLLSLHLDFVTWSKIFIKIFTLGKLSTLELAKRELAKWEN